jgi:hypothetical protein
MVQETIFSVLVVGSVILSTAVWIYLVWLTQKLIKDPEGLMAENHG